MPFNDKAVVVDLNKKPVPQYFNDLANQYEVSKGHYGAPFFHEKGTIVKEMWVGSGNTNKTFTEDIYGLYLRNDSLTERLTLTINGHSMFLEPDEWIDEKFIPFRSVSIVTSGSYRAIARI